jgi:hypothetical protein
MNDKEKIDLMDYIIKYMQEKVTSQDIPIMVGLLNKETGVIGFKKADIGHPVFEFKDRYIIYLESNDGKTTISVPYYKETLKNYIDFMA